VWQRAEPIGSEKVFAKLRAGPLQAQKGGRGGSIRPPLGDCPNTLRPRPGAQRRNGGLQGNLQHAKGARPRRAPARA